MRKILVLLLIMSSFYSSIGFALDLSDSTAEVKKEAAPQIVDYDTYLMKGGDRINIKIYPTDEYIKGGEKKISSEGNIILPVVGKVEIAGKTVIQAEKYLADILEKDYFVSPEVVIEVVEFKDLQFVALGEVKRPGTFSFPPGQNSFTLLEAIALAGGFSDIANIKKIKVIRDIPGEPAQKFKANAEKIISGDEEDLAIRPGDVIHVAESLF